MPASLHPKVVAGFTSPRELANLNASPMEPLGTQKELLFTLVLQVGFSASLAALLVRFVKFRRVLFNEIRDSDQKVLLLLFLTPPLAIGVVLRIVGYHFFDLTLPGAFLLGLLRSEERRVGKE